MRQALFKQAAGGFVAKIVAAGLAFVVAILLARYLGVDAFGKYSLAMSAVNILTTLAALGLPMLIVREVAIYRSAGQWSDLKGIIHAGNKWPILASLFMVLLALVGQLWVPDQLLGTLWLGMLLVPLLALNQMRAAVLRGLNWVVLADIPELLFRPLIVLFFLLAIAYGNIQINELGALVIQMVAAIGAFAAGTVMLRSRMPAELGPARASETKKEWFTGGIIFLGMALISMVEGQTALLLTGLLSGAKDAGIYQAASQIVSLLIFGLMAVNMALQPKLAAAWSQGNRELAQHLATYSARLGTAVAMLMGGILMLFAEPLLALFGAAFGDGATALRILVVGQLANAAAGSCGIVLAMTGNQHIVLRGVMMALSANAALCGLLIPVWGVSGAAIAASAGLLLWNSYLAIQARKLTGIRTTIFNG